MRRRTFAALGGELITFAPIEIIGETAFNTELLETASTQFAGRINPDAIDP